jgi:manganese/zinc/iron transport system permease protein
LSVFFGVGVLLLSFVQELPQTAAAGLQHYIYGQASGMRLVDVYAMLSISFVTLIFILVFRKELATTAFDREFAFAIGLPVFAVDLIFLLLLLILSIVGFQNVGLLLMVALLIIPAATARLWTDLLNKYLILSAIFGGLSCYLGTALSASLSDFPTGAIIVLIASVFFAISLLLSPKSGIISKVFTEKLYF